MKLIIINKMYIKHFLFYTKTFNKNSKIDKTIFISSNRDIIMKTII